jgi:hypothetical protein
MKEAITETRPLVLDALLKIPANFHVVTEWVPVSSSKARKEVTSHRARSTIASLLYNAREPMTLFELQEWLGHSTPTATQHYAKITPLKVAKSYADSGYFARNLRAIEVLVDQDAVRSGRAATEPWKFYDLGHGYCTYDFFEQCQHAICPDST